MFICNVQPCCCENESRLSPGIIGSAHVKGFVGMASEAWRGGRQCNRDCRVSLREDMVVVKGDELSDELLG